MTRKKHTGDKKLHNFDEKLHSSYDPDLSLHEKTNLLPQDAIEGGPEVYYFTVEDGNTHPRQFLARELIPDENETEGAKKKTKRETPKTKE